MFPCTYQVVSPEERMARIRMNEARMEERRQHEMRMTMAILMVNARKEPYNPGPNHGQVSPYPQDHRTSYF